MSKLAEEIWKIIWCSLVVVTISIGFLRYRDNDHWWEINRATDLEEYENNPLLYYSIKGIDSNSAVSAELFVINTSQKKLEGNCGVFDNILPGQIVSVRIFSGDRSIRSPSFRLQNREIRHLTFAIDKEKNQLAYAGDHSRLRKISPPALYRSGAESAPAVLNIENYNPLKEAAAKENPKKAVEDNNVEDSNIEKDDNINNFFGYKSLDHLLNR